MAKKKTARTGFSMTPSKRRTCFLCPNPAVTGFGGLALCKKHWGH